MIRWALDMLIAPDEAPSPDFGRGQAIKVTRSLCPWCLTSIDAEVFARDGEVWMDKRCPEHGPVSVRIASDVRHYYEFDPEVVALGGSCCGDGRQCGDQTANHSCNLLIEITQRCNLTCPTCYADSSPAREEFMTLAEFEALLDGLLAAGKDDADLLQLSGGEPTIHPEFFAILEATLQRGVRRVYVNTNGIMLARPEFAERLSSYADRVSVYLQFDGLQRRALQILRGRESLLETKLRALDQCERLGLDTVLVMTLTEGVNDAELGELIRYAAGRRCVHKLMIQPAIQSGRNDQPRVRTSLTVADVIARIVAQTDGLLTTEDFGPIPCSDPNCFNMALALTTPDGLFPVSRYFPRYETWSALDNQDLIAQLSDTFDNAGALQRAVSAALAGGALASLPDAELDQLLDQISAWQRVKAASVDDHAGWGGLFAIGIKPFMDAYNYDQDRIDRCCVHIVSRDGTPVSFCQYNALDRPQGRR